jgi:hypothetical protein
MYCGFVGRCIRSLATAFRYVGLLSAAGAGGIANSEGNDCGAICRKIFVEKQIAPFCSVRLGYRSTKLSAWHLVINEGTFICGCEYVLHSDEPGLRCSPEFRCLTGMAKPLARSVTAVSWYLSLCRELYRRYLTVYKE